MAEAKINHGRKRGIYETIFGNTCLVSGPTAKTAWDLDAAERIPMELVGHKFIRKAEPSDSPKAYNY